MQKILFSTAVLMFMVQLAFPQPNLSTIKNFDYSTMYTVIVGDSARYVYESTAALQTRGTTVEQTNGIKKMSFVNFDLPQSGPAHIKVIKHGGFMSYDFRPFEADSSFFVTIDADTLEFDIAKPQHVVMRFNASWENVLVLFANPYHVKPDPSEVTYYFDNKTFHDTYAGSLDIDPADKDNDIQDPSEIPQILLNEGESVYIEDGAVVRARFALNGNVNAKIYGRGVIVHGVGHHEQNSWVIRANGPKSIHLEGVTVADPFGWVVSIFGGNNNIVDNFKTVCCWHFNNDGVQLGGNNSEIKNCFLQCNDDNISLSGGGKNIDITNNVFWNIFNGGAVNFGWGYPNYDGVYIHDNVFIRHGDCCGAEFPGQNLVYRRKAPFTAISWGEGTLKNIEFTNNIMEEVILESEWIHFQTIEDKGDKAFAVDGMLIENLDVVNANRVWGLLRSYGENKIQNVTFKNVRINGKVVNSQQDGGIHYEAVNASTITYLPPDVAASSVPATPELTDVVNLGNSKAFIKWRDKSDNETGFKIMRSTNETDWVVVDTIGAHATNYLHSTANFDTYPHYKVVAYNDYGNSDGDLSSVINISSSVGIEVAPNPFVDEVAITLSVTESVSLHAEVYNLMGQQVDVLMNESFQPGSYAYRWNAQGLPAGYYLVFVKIKGSESIPHQLKLIKL